jgi:putative flavoprotein involved in K+ transport
MDSSPRMTQPGLDNEPLDVLVIGGGQAGLVMGFHLPQRGQRFKIVDAGASVGQTWRLRWDSLKLFTAAQYDNLPGMTFPASHDSYRVKTTSPTSFKRTRPSSSYRWRSTRR